MTKPWVRWASASGVAAALTVVYLAVPGVRSAVNTTVLTLVTGSTGDTRTYWCPMDPDIVRKGPGMCPV